MLSSEQRVNNEIIAILPNVVKGEILNVGEELWNMDAMATLWPDDVRLLGLGRESAQGGKAGEAVDHEVASPPAAPMKASGERESRPSEIRMGENQEPNPHH